MVVIIVTKRRREVKNRLLGVVVSASPDPVWPIDGSDGNILEKLSPLSLPNTDGIAELLEAIYTDETPRAHLKCD